MSKLRHLWPILLLMLILSLLTPTKGRASLDPVIHLLSPGDGSRVTTPIEIRAELDLAEANLVRVSLTDRNQAVISRQLRRTNNQDNFHPKFITALAFEIPGESTQALLSLSIVDDYNRTRSLRSVNLTLLSDGVAEIAPNPKDASWLILAEPQAFEIIASREVRVSGTVTPINDNPIFFELVTESGGVIGTSQLAVEIVDQPMDFEVTMTYGFTTTSSNVLLTIRQSSLTFGTTVILDSLPLSLSP